jgi:hypothetical protein
MSKSPTHYLRWQPDGGRVVLYANRAHWDLISANFPRGLVNSVRPICWSNPYRADVTSKRKTDSFLFLLLEETSDFLPTPQNWFKNHMLFYMFLHQIHMRWTHNKGAVSVCPLVFWKLLDGFSKKLVSELIVLLYLSLMRCAKEVHNQEIFFSLSVSNLSLNSEATERFYWNVIFRSAS